MSAGNVVISERAARRIGEILKTEGDGAMLRISVEGGGCSGFQYKFDIERAKADDDLVISRDSAVGVLPSAGRSSTSGVVILPSGRTGTERDSSGLRQTIMLTVSSGPIRYS
jgi:iron-sulfur cluster assembly accessory protein